MLFFPVCKTFTKPTSKASLFMPFVKRKKGSQKNGSNIFSFFIRFAVKHSCDYVMLSHENVKKGDEKSGKSSRCDGDARELNKYRINTNNILSKVLSQ